MLIKSYNLLVFTVGNEVFTEVLVIDSNTHTRRGRNITAMQTNIQHVDKSQGRQD